MIKFNMKDEFIGQSMKVKAKKKKKKKKKGKEKKRKKITVQAYFRAM